MIRQRLEDLHLQSPQYLHKSSIFRNHFSWSEFKPHGQSKAQPFKGMGPTEIVKLFVCSDVLSFEEFGGPQVPDIVHLTGCEVVALFVTLACGLID